MSERMACRLTGLSRSAYRRPLQGDTVADPDGALRAWLRAYARKHPTVGIPARVPPCPRRGLGRQPQEDPAAVAGRRAAASAAAGGAERGWAVDFPFDADEQGRPIKICSIVDEHTGECIGGLVDRSITADRLTAHLEDLAAQRGDPASNVIARRLDDEGERNR